MLVKLELKQKPPGMERAAAGGSPWAQTPHPPARTLSRCQLRRGGQSLASLTVGSYAAAVAEGVVIDGFDEVLGDGLHRSVHCGADEHLQEDGVVHQNAAVAARRRGTGGSAGLRLRSHTAGDPVGTNLGSPDVEGQCGHFDVGLGHLGGSPGTERGLKGCGCPILGEHHLELILVGPFTPNHPARADGGGQ